MSEFLDRNSCIPAASMKRVFPGGLASVVLLLAVMLSTVVNGQTGSISGVVVDVKGKPVEDVIVTWYRSIISRDDKEPPQGSALTDKKGGFAFPGMIAGTYYLCTESDADRSLVANCAWTRTPPSVTIRNGESMTAVKLAVQSGVRVDIEMRDPKKKLAAPESATGVAGIRVGLIGSDGMLRSAKIVGRADTAHFYSIVVPPNVDVSVQAATIGLKIADEHGARVDRAGVTSSFRVADGDATKKLKFDVDVDDGK